MLGLGAYVIEHPIETVPVSEHGDDDTKRSGQSLAPPAGILSPRPFGRVDRTADECCIDGTHTIFQGRCS